MAIEFTELSVCTECLMMAANGECDPEYADQFLSLWPTDYVIPGDVEFGFSWTDCEGCGSALGGDRHQAFIESV